MPLDQLDQLAQMTKEVAAPSVAILLYLTDPHKVLCADFLYHFHLLVDLHHSLLDSTTNMEVHGNACTDSKKTGLHSFVDKSILSLTCYQYLYQSHSLAPPNAKLACSHTSYFENWSSNVWTHHLAPECPRLVRQEFDHMLKLYLITGNFSLFNSQYF